jgi:hypothetical protein
LVSVNWTKASPAQPLPKRHSVPCAGQARWPDLYRMSTKSYGNSSSSTGIALLAVTVVEVVAMLWTLFAILLVLWLLGWGFHIAGALIHVLLVIAVLLLIVNLVTGGTTHNT